MLEFLTKLFTEQLKLSADMWLTVLMVVVIVAFAVSLIAGLVGGAFSKIKANMKRAVQKPNTAVAQMKSMPASVKHLYKTARVTGAKPSALVTQQVCVDEPFKHSIVSKIWLVTLITTLLCAGLAALTSQFAALPEKAKPAVMAAEIAKKSAALYLSPTFILILGGLLTMVGGIIGKLVYGGAVKTYGKFAPVIDGDGHGGAEQQAQQAVYSEPQATAYEPQANAYEPQAAYAEPQAEVYNEQPMYAEPQAAYGNATAYDEPVAVMADAPQESDEEIRRRAREEAMAQAKAQQAAAQAQAQAQAQQQAQARPAGTSSADDVIAQIEKISREGAPRETMRDVATLLQKERAKPENKTPEQQKRLNEALSKLLKAMSAATKK